MKAVIANWIAALRSGKFEQGECALYDPYTNCYCALGVLAKVHDIPFSKNGDVLLDKYGNRDGYHPLNRLLGVDDDKLDIIWRMNDTKEMTFEEIADALEAGIPEWED